MKGDHVHVHDGIGIALGEGRSRMGWVRPLRDGQPIPAGAELMQHKGGHCYESLGVVHAGVAGGGVAGPAQVATAAYREGYDRIFGRRAERGQA